jgi:hypothetical protein
MYIWENAIISKLLLRILWYIVLNFSRIQSILWTKYCNRQKIQPRDFNQYTRLHLPQFKNNILGIIPVCMCKHDNSKRNECRKMKFGMQFFDQNCSFLSNFGNNSTTRMGYRSDIVWLYGFFFFFFFFFPKFKKETKIMYCILYCW